MEKVKLSDFKEINPIIIICGPTASGKTDLSYKFYEEIDSELISADSRQVYRYLNIGTAKPPTEELNKYPYHLIDFLEPSENFSAGKFSQIANEIINQIYQQNKVPIVVGGTGFYISALCDGIIETNEDADNFEYFDIDSYHKVRQLSREELFQLLQKVDFPASEKYSDKNPHRLIRALEYYFKFGKRISEARIQEVTTNFTPIYFAIDFSRENLYQRINERCLQMIEQGLVEEVKTILDSGFTKELNSLNTVGYKEIIQFLESKIPLEIAISEIQKNTRRYAKRQLTWFRKNSKINWLKPEEIYNLKIRELLKGKII